MSIEQAYADNFATNYAVNYTSFNVRALTEDVFVKPLHSHNDYWRPVPLFSALQHGVQSVECDVYSFQDTVKSVKTVTPSTNTSEVTEESTEFTKGTLYVGHDLSYLNEIWTLDSVYLDPLFALLEDANPQWDPEETNTYDYKHGVFYGDSDATLYLFIDYKNNPNTTYQSMKKSLKKFRDKDYLTYYDNDKEEWVMGPLTIVITGTQPIELVKAEPTRFITLDGRLNETDFASYEEQKKYSIIASTSYSKIFGNDDFHKRGFNSTEIDLLTNRIDLAHEAGLKTRIWEHTNFPKFIRESENKAIFNAGTDFLNIDYLDISENF